MDFEDRNYYKKTSMKTPWSRPQGQWWNSFLLYLIVIKLLKAKIARKRSCWSLAGDIRILGYDTSYLESISKKTMYLEAHRPSMMMERVSANRKTSIDLFLMKSWKTSVESIKATELISRSNRLKVDLMAW